MKSDADKTDSFALSCQFDLTRRSVCDIDRQCSISAFKTNSMQPFFGTFFYSVNTVQQTGNILMKYGINTVICFPNARKECFSPPRYRAGKLPNKVLV